MEAAIADNAVLALPEAGFFRIGAHGVFEPAHQFTVGVFAADVLDRKAHDRCRQARILAVQRNKRRKRLQRHGRRRRGVAILDQPDRVLAAERDLRKARMIQGPKLGSSSRGNPQGESLLQRRVRLGWMCVMGAAGADLLIENVPMPELAVAAEIELTGTNAPDGHADLRQFRAAVDGRRAAGKQGPHPRRIEFLVGRHEPLEVGGLERTGHRRQRRARPATEPSVTEPSATVFRNSRRSICPPHPDGQEHVRTADSFFTWFVIGLLLSWTHKGDRPQEGLPPIFAWRKVHSSRAHGRFQASWADYGGALLEAASADWYTCRRDSNPIADSNP